VLASITTFAVHGIDSRRVIVEVDVPDRGLSAFTMVRKRRYSRIAWPREG
jgi:hypothetical protein